MINKLQTEIDDHNKLIDKLQQPMYSNNSTSGQKYLYFDPHNEPWSYVIKIVIGKEQIAYKRFKNAQSALAYRDMVIDELIEDLQNKIKLLQDEIDKIKFKEKNADYIASIKKLKKSLKSDLKSATSQSGEKYISYDKTSNAGRYAVFIYLKNEKLVDKRFEHLRDAVRFRDNIIPSVLAELDARLKKYDED